MGQIEKMKTLKVLIIGLAWVAFMGCNSENEEDLLPEEEICIDNTATLSGSVSSIINTNCAMPGCHVSGTGRANFTVKENIIANASTIQNFTQNGIMPPPESGRALNDLQKQNIFCWVENGALDN